MPAAPSRPKLLASWDASKQHQYRQRHVAQLMHFHLLLDASPSMHGEPAQALRTAYAMYLAWLQAHADPMSLAEVRSFSTALSPSRLAPLNTLRPLTLTEYDPRQGDGTALYRAVGETVTTARGPGQHVLIVFTDGADNASAKLGWTETQVQTLLTTVQEQDDWLVVFLGAMPSALAVGIAMGFRAGNCLPCQTDRIAEAFLHLQRATQRYLGASPQARKLLATGGIF